MKALVYLNENKQGQLTVKDQREKIENFANHYSIEIVDYYADADRDKMMNTENEYDIILVEKAQVLGSSMKEVASFLNQVDSKDKAVISTTYSWDYVSQNIRNRYKTVEKSILSSKEVFANTKAHTRIHNKKLVCA